MRNWLRGNWLRGKLSVRVSAWIVLFATIIFLATLTFLFAQAREAVRKEAINRATQILDEAVLRTTGITDRVETASNMATRIVERNLNVPDSMFAYSKAMLLNNPDFFNHSIAFEPFYFQKYGRYLSAYSKREGSDVKVRQGGSDNYQYYYMDWYLLPQLLEHPCWTEPYMDFDEATGTKERVASYCQSIHDRNGKVIGVVNTSIALNWLSKIIEERKPYPNSYVIMISRGGAFFAHPDSTKLLCQSIFTGTIEHPDSARVALGRAMQNGEEGMRQLNYDGQDCYIFYKPLGNTGWSVAIVCPENDIFGDYYKLRRMVVGLVIMGLLVMFVFFVNIITRQLKPLRLLTKEAGTIASGRFDIVLPDFKRTDEIGQLSESFGEMQQSLVSYIDELKETTATKAAIENELRVASDIQMSMVPRTFPPFPEHKDIDLHASMTPAKEVGGDLYNFLLNENCLYFAVGDVSGKGVPASLFMAQATRLFRTLAGEGFSPEAIADRMNSGLCEGNDTMMFVTMFIGVVHLDTGQLDYCNCGHNPPVLDGEFITFKYKNRPLGLMDGIPFQEESIADIRGKQLLVYTDGLNEAMNTEKEQFGNDRLLEAMANAKDMTSCQVVDMLKEAVEQHRAGADPNDDLTLLCLKIEK